MNLFSKTALCLGGVLVATGTAGLTAANAKNSPEITILRDNNIVANTAEMADAIAQFPPVEERQDADAYLVPVNNTVSITLVNTSPAMVSYMVPGTGKYETLMPDEEIELTGIATPAQVGFRQLDGGLTYAEISEISPDRNSVTIEMSYLAPAEFYANPNLITRSIIVGDSGGIYIN